MLRIAGFLFAGHLMIFFGRKMLMNNIQNYYCLIIMNLIMNIEIYCIIKSWCGYYGWNIDSIVNRVNNKHFECVTIDVFVVVDVESWRNVMWVLSCGWIFYFIQILYTFTIDFGV